MRFALLLALVGGCATQQHTYALRNAQACERAHAEAVAQASPVADQIAADCRYWAAEAAATAPRPVQFGAAHRAAGEGSRTTSCTSRVASTGRYVQTDCF